MIKDIFEVWIDSSFKRTREFSKEMENLANEFQKPFIREVEITQSHAIEPGGPIYPNPTDVRYGTLGAFAKASKSEKTFYAGLTCRHVTMRSENKKSYIKTNNLAESTPLVELGPNIDSNTSDDGVKDSSAAKREHFDANTDSLVAVQIEKEKADKYCNLQLMKNNEPFRSVLFEGDDSLNDQLVYKKGAKTNWTKGTIIASDFAGPCGIIIKGTKEEPFCEGGDSGSVVFRYLPNSAEDKTIEVISMVQGEASERDSKRVIGTMSFRLMDAIQHFTKNTRITLELI